MATAADAALAQDLAKIDLIVEQYRVYVGDDQLTFADIGNLLMVSERFGVTFKRAYHRARDLGLLSWQVAEADAAPSLTTGEETA